MTPDGPFGVSASTPSWGSPVTDGYYLTAVEEAFIDFHRSGDYTTFARAVRDILVAWRAR